jgi:hypothetical protein
MKKQLKIPAGNNYRHLFGTPLYGSSICLPEIPLGFRQQQMEPAGNRNQQAHTFETDHGRIAFLSEIPEIRVATRTKRMSNGTHA